MAAGSKQISKGAHLKEFQFRPGQSGNPLGRRSNADRFALAIGAKTNNGEDLLAYAIKVFKGEEPGDRWAALQWLADRFLGRVKQSVELTGEDGGPVEFSDTGNQLRSRVVALVRLEGPAEGRAALPAPSADRKPIAG